jgi:hypothetical protein
MPEQHDNSRIAVVGLRSVGSAYRGGVRSAGFGTLYLSDGTDRYVPEEHSHGNKMLDYADQLGYDTKQMREDLEYWVQHGRFPDGRSMQFRLHA